MSEATLQTHVVKLLNSFARPDILYFAVPNGEARSAKTGARLKQQGVRAGAADLCFVIDGRFVGLELKTEVGTLSKAQLKFMEDCERAGGEYCVAFGLDWAIKTLVTMKAFRPGVKVGVSNVA